MKRLLASWHQLPDGARRVIHTSIQAAVGVLLSQLLVARSASDVKAAVVVAGAAGLAAVKAVLVRPSAPETPPVAPTQPLGQ